MVERERERERERVRKRKRKKMTRRWWERIVIKNSQDFIKSKNPAASSEQNPNNMKIMNHRMSKNKTTKSHFKVNVGYSLKSVICYDDIEIGNPFLNLRKSFGCLWNGVAYVFLMIWWSWKQPFVTMNLFFLSISIRLHQLIGSGKSLKGLDLLEIISRWLKRPIFWIVYVPAI